MKLNLDMGDYFETRNVPYRAAVGRFMYFMRGMKPDLAATMEIVNRFCHKPGKAHWDAVKRILRYVA